MRKEECQETIISKECFFYLDHDGCRRSWSAPISKGDTVSTTKTLLTKGIMLCSAALSLWVCCSSPTQETLQWRTAIELPVSNASFVLGGQFQDLFGAIKDLKDFSMRGIDSFTVDSISDPKHPHCIAFSKTNKDTISFTQEQDTMGNKTFQVVIGAIPLSNAGNSAVRVGFNVSGALSSDVRQNDTGTITLPKIRRITIDPDPANGRLPVHIVNSTNATIDSVIITLANVLPSPPSQAVGRLASGASADVTLNVTGKSIGNTLQVQISGILKAGGSIAAGSGLDVSFSLSGLRASSAIVMDSMLALVDTFTNEYKITDSVDFDYADIEDGFFNYILDNRSGIDIYVSAEHHDLWATPVCIRKNIVIFDSLPLVANYTDSFNYYSGIIIDGDRHVEPRQNKRFARLNLSGNRMFPKWVGAHSVTRVDYIVRTEPRGLWDTVSSNDELIFTIQPAAVNYKQMAGVLVKDFDKTSDTQSVEVPFPWPKANQDSLRGNFVLQKVLANMNLILDMPDSAFLDSLKVTFKVFSPDFPDSVVDTNMTFGTIKNDTNYNRSLNITKVVNNFPDSVKIVTHVKVPVGTRIRAINDMNLFDKNIGTMVVKAFVNYKMNAYFDWAVSDVTTMDLGADTFTIEEKGIRAFRRMQDRSFTFGLRVTNESNVNIRLYALFASDSLRTRLYVDSMALNEVNYRISTPGAADSVGLVNLLGSEGVYIPPRKGIVNDSVTLDDWQMYKILGTNKGSMRWMLRFVKSARDSMTNVDNIKINSWIHLEGVNNMDSVVTAFE
jgi:hypothetical protein